MAYYDKPWKTILAHKLLAEVNGDEGVGTVCECINTDEDAALVRLYFSSEPTGPEKGAIDGIYDAHDPSESSLAIDALIPDDQGGADFRAIDYKTGLLGRLHKVIETMYRGELREVRYYIDSTETALALVVSVYSDEARTAPGYSRTSLGQPVERWTERTWYREDGTPHPSTKITHKQYSHDPIAQMTEGFRRRQNQIDKLSVDLLRAYVGTTAADPANPTQAELDAAYDAVTTYNDKYEGPLTTFVRVGRNDFLTPPASPNVTDDAESWLDHDVEPLGYPAGWTIRTIIIESVKNISAP